ncbi:MAG: transporter substrate-binding domain-containing protein [Firmicutes bacterium]|nr:transporter substrate-binding domain-containing protein [Bacillota bacterium]
MEGKSLPFIFSIFLVGYLTITGFVKAIDNDMTIKVAGDNHFPPYEYVDERGIYKGFNVDIIRAIAIETGVDIEIHPMTWYEALDALEKGEIDAIQGMKYNEKRDAYYDFSEEYLISSQAIFVSNENRYIVDLGDLKDQKVSVQKGDVSTYLLENIEGVELIWTENQEEALQLLAANHVDAFVGNRNTGLYIIQKNRWNDLIKIVGEPINPTKYAVAVKEGNKAVLDIFNKGITAIKADGTYEKIYRKWFGEDVQKPPIFLKRFLYFLLVILSVSLFASVVVFRLNRLLQLEVRKRTMQLKKQDQFKEQILNSIFYGIATINKAGIITSINDPGKRIIDAKGEKLEGKHYKKTPLEGYFKRTHLIKVLRTGRKYIAMEMEKKFGDITKVIEYNIYPLISGNNKIEGAIVSFSNITNIKRLKENLIIKDKMQALGEMAASIAHEIKNPLTSIKAFIELIPDKYDNQEFREQVFKYVPSEIQRLSNLLNNLLDYSKPYKNTKELFDVSRLFDEVLILFSNQFKKYRIKLNPVFEKGLYVYADRQQFKQIIINIMLNAVESMDLGGELTISGKSSGSHVIIAISDTGHGIPPEDLKKIFEPFFTRKKYGTGLGLSIAYQFVKENNGNIEIRSIEGQGTEVILKFPLV